MFANRAFVRLACKRQLQRPAAAAVAGVTAQQRLFSFSFAGPKTLEDILKKKLVEDKTATEVSDLWFTYHENKVRTHVKLEDDALVCYLIPCLLDALGTNYFLTCCRSIGSQMCTA